MKATKTFTALDWGKQLSVDFVGEMGLFSFNDNPMMPLNRTSICYRTGSKSLKFLFHRPFGKGRVINSIHYLI